MYLSPKKQAAITGGLVSISSMGKAIELAGDELTMPQVAEVFSRVLGLPVRFIERPISEAYRVGKESAIMMEWFKRYGYRADINALHVIHPGMMTLGTFLLLMILRY